MFINLQEKQKFVEMTLKLKDSSWKKSFIPKIFATKIRRKSEDYTFPEGFDSNSAFSAAPAVGERSLPAARGFNPSLGRSSFGDFNSSMSNFLETRPFKIFVATWNVGGKPPHNGLNLDDFLGVDDQSDIYVLGFQEIVPLNAGNVLVIEDHEPAAKWLLLISESLNRSSSTSEDANNSAPSDLASSFSCQTSRDSKVFGGPISFQRPSLRTISKSFRIDIGRKLKTCNCPSDVERKHMKDSCFRCQQAHVMEYDSSSEEDEGEASLVAKSLVSASDNSQRRYSLVACKQMVGIFLTVWAKKEHLHHIGHLRISNVGRGIMGCLGNKGCISLSMSLHQTSLCFVCSHLASGEKEGDELRRNSDVVEILRNTQFRKICRSVFRRMPEKILDHERVIWLGDLNYRIALSYLETKTLLQDNDWDALLEKDQLKIEREAGRVFEGWNEGKIFFAPTYKYSQNSDSYAGELITCRKKRRTPAWCDRILWHGDGISQLSYIRGESRFSDHRPVCGVFMVDIEMLARSSKGNIKVAAEELLPPSNGYTPLKSM